MEEAVHLPDFFRSYSDDRRRQALELFQREDLNHLVRDLLNINEAPVRLAASSAAASSFGPLCIWQHFAIDHTAYARVGL